MTVEELTGVFYDRKPLSSSDHEFSSGNNDAYNI